MSFIENEVLYDVATIDDWDELAHFRNIYSNEGIKLAKSKFNINFIDDLNKVNSEIFKATHNEEIVGYGRCSFFDPYENKPLYGLLHEIPKGPYLSGILIHEKVRGHKVGIKLTQSRIDWAKERSDRIYCYLQKDNMPSIQMHQKLGFKMIVNNLKYPSDAKNQKTGLLYQLKF